MAIYIVYFVVLAAAFILELPYISRDFQTGSNAAAQDFDMKLTHKVMPSTDFLSIDLGESGDILPSQTISDGNTTVEVAYSKAELKVTALDGKIGHGLGSSLLLEVLAHVAQLAILILMGIIINSLRRSIRDGRPLQRSNIVRTRWIGGLILVSGLFTDFSAYMQNRAAEVLLAGSGVAVDTAFHLSYWNLFMGILVLFTAEVFAIGHKLGEEQQLTI